MYIYTHMASLMGKPMIMKSLDFGGLQELQQFVNRWILQVASCDEAG